MARRAGAVPSGSLPSAKEIRRMLSADPVRKAYGVRLTDAVSASALMRDSVNPMQSLPVSASVGEFTEAISLFGDNRDRYGRFRNRADDPYAEAMEEYSYTDDGYEYSNRAEDARQATSGPAPMSLVPTSTINPDRPRTVAAGYVLEEQKLSVVFRDGTFYNYYEVTKPEWDAFKANRSKGRYILRFLDSKPRGIADVSDAQTAAARQLLYRVARTSQSTTRDNGRRARQINYESKRDSHRRF